jgi:hypothetical protein
MGDSYGVYRGLDFHCRLWCCHHQSTSIYAYEPGTQRILASYIPRLRQQHIQSKPDQQRHRVNFREQGYMFFGILYAISQAALNVGQSNVTVEFSGPAPSGPTVFNVTTFNGNSFQWNTSSPAFNPHIGHETLVFDSYDGYVAYSNPLYVYSLNVTNTGTANVTIEGGSCTTGNCGPFPTTLHPNIVTVLKFGSPNPCPGYITFSAATALGNIFDFYVKAC